MTTLPKMGRPSITGLSIKELGVCEYQRIYRLNHPKKIKKTPRTKQNDTKT
jgi:hypothetical protein